MRNNSKDIHAITAALIFGRPASRITPSQRRIAKTINMMMYGCGVQPRGHPLDASALVRADFAEIEAEMAAYGALKDHGPLDTMPGSKEGTK